MRYGSKFFAIGSSIEATTGVFFFLQQSSITAIQSLSHALAAIFIGLAVLFGLLAILTEIAAISKK